MELPNYIRTLEKAGVNRKQAEAHVQINFEFMEKRMEKFATKEDFKRLESKIEFMEKDIIRIEKKTDNIHDELRSFKLDVREGFRLISERFVNLEQNLEQKIVSKLSKTMIKLVSGATAVITLCGYLF